MYTIIIGKKVSKFFAKHAGQYIIKDAEKAIHILAINPYKNQLDTKLMKGFTNTYRVRLGKYRLIYEVFEDKVEIHFLDIGSRGDVYNGK